MKRFRIILAAAICFGCTFLFSCNSRPELKPLYEHVIVIGLDGMTQDGFHKAQTPVMDKLAAEGAVKYNVRTVMPSISSPNWNAMMYGAGPEATGVTSNKWRNNGEWMPPVVKTSEGRFPGIHYIVRQQRPDAEQGAIFHWGGFGDLVPKDVCNMHTHGRTPDSTTLLACNYIEAKKPAFLFIQLDHIDGAGHRNGYQSEAYLPSIANADSLIGRLMQSIRTAGIENSTLVMVVSDHGGIDKGHGGEKPEEINVPVIYWGSGVKKGYEVKHPVYMYDVAPTIAFALGLKQPYAWTGRPVLAAFEGFNEPEN